MPTGARGKTWADTRGVRIAVWPAAALRVGETRKFPIYPQACPSLENIKLTWSMKYYGIVLIWLIYLFIKLFSMLFKQS